MTKESRTIETKLRRIRDTSSFLPRITREQVREALGAEETTTGLAEALAPVTLFAVREELVNRLQCSSGRPAIAGITRRTKSPLDPQ